MEDTGMNEKIRKKMEEYNNNKIIEKYKELECIKILNVKDRGEVDNKIISAFDEIRKIEYQKSFSIKECDKSYKYVEYLYKRNEYFRWLIPRFEGGCKWYEIIVFNLYDFFKIYFEDRIFDDFSVADLDNGMVFDIENGEKDIDFYIKKL